MPRPRVTGPGPPPDRIGRLINLNAERVERHPPELDTRCRDCERTFGGLAQLVDHYAFECGAPKQRHPSSRWR